MKQLYILGSLAFLFFAQGCGNDEPEVAAPQYDAALLQRIRAASAVVPGPLPTSVSYVKYAESIRKWSDVIEGGSDDASKMARTAFQVSYPDGYVMIDAGMDREVHKFFEKDGSQPFDENKANTVRQALSSAKMILITHEHADHAAGIIRTAVTGGVPQKTLLTEQQAMNLENNPHTPEIKLEAENRKQYIIASFESILPVAPGMVLIKAPGHTSGEIMIYTQLQNGREYIFTGDVSWTYQGIAEIKEKPASERKRIGENGDLVKKQLTWLNQLMTNERITMIVSHDDIMMPQYVGMGLMNEGFQGLTGASTDSSALRP